MNLLKRWWFTPQLVAEPSTDSNSLIFISTLLGISFPNAQITEEQRIAEIQAEQLARQEAKAKRSYEKTEKKESRIARSRQN
jgi:hypothetical protein